MSKGKDSSLVGTFRDSFYGLRDSSLVDSISKVSPILVMTLPLVSFFYLAGVIIRRDRTQLYIPPQKKRYIQNMPLLIIGADPYVYFYFIIKYSKCEIKADGV